MRNEKMLRLISYIVGIAILFFGILYLFKGRYLNTAILFVLGAAVFIPCRFLVTEKTVTALSCYSLVMINILVLVASTLNDTFIVAVPLYICAVIISMLFLSANLVKASFACGICCYGLQICIMSCTQGALIAEPAILVELCVALVISLILTLSGVKACNMYLMEAEEGRAAVEKTVADLDRKQAQTEQMMETQQTLLRRILEIASQLSNQADNLSGKSGTMASGATEQAASVENARAETTGLKDKALQVKELSAQAKTASDDMEKRIAAGSEQIKGLVNTVETIGDSLSKISAISKTINDIAFQTNILALNAAVEAARAGTAGKGFAVVAGEVRTLAANSSNAAAETETIVSECPRVVQASNEIAKESSVSLNSLICGIGDLAKKIERIPVAADEQVVRTEVIQQDMEQIAAVGQDMAALAEETAAMVEEVSGLANQLKHMAPANGMDESAHRVPARRL